MKQYRALSVALGLFVASAAASVQAQIDSDPPLLQGQDSYHVYSVPGVFNDGMSPVFSCTNVSSASVIVGVEVFGPAGGASLNNASATSQVVPSGGTVTFTGQAMAGILGPPVNLAVGIVYGGSARILATDRSKVLCSAFLADPSNIPPNSGWNLTVAKKNKQKGD
jgi:hypothetical protein